MKKMLKKSKKLVLVLLAAVLIIGLYQAPAQAATVKCSKLATAVKGKASSGFKKTTKKSSCTFLTSSYRKNVKDFYYATDSDQVYVVCIVRANSTSNAKKIKSKFDSILKSQKNSSYLSSSQKKVVKATQTGRSGNYVWYISLSTSSSTNKKAVSALKAKL